MMDPQEKPAAANGNGSRGLRRLQFELALDLSLPAGRPIQETLAQAAQTAGVDLLFVLPAPNGQGVTGVVRISEEGRDTFLQVRPADGGFSVADEETMDQTLLRLARASLDIFQRMSADRVLRAQLKVA
jgi:hypothetical protein